MDLLRYIQECAVYGWRSRDDNGTSKEGIWLAGKNTRCYNRGVRSGKKEHYI